MTDRHSTESGDADLVRVQLHHLVDDVEPRPDTLPHLLAASRRRRRHPRRPLLAVVGAAVAVAAFLIAVVASPSDVLREPEPVSIAPNSYLAQAEPGVLASFDVVSGRQLYPVARVPGRSTGVLAADGHRVYTVAVGGGESGVVEVSADGATRVVEPHGTRVTVLTAGAGRVAYVDGRDVVVESNGVKQRIPVSPGLVVRDLSLGADGRLAVLATSGVPGATGVYFVDSAASSMPGRPTIAPMGCTPWAVSWAGAEVGVLSPVDCEAPRSARVGMFDPASGEQLGAGVPFDLRAGAVRSDAVALSADRLGRFLVSGAGTRQWLVDGADVQVVPKACSPGGACAATPATFWG